MRDRKEIAAAAVKLYEQFHAHSDPCILGIMGLILETQLDIRDLLANPPKV